MTLQNYLKIILAKFCYTDSASVVCEETGGFRPLLFFII